MLRPEPPAGALPLIEAFLRHGNPDAAELVRQRPSCLWLDQDGPVFEAKVTFLSRIRHGELVCWARHRPVGGPWSLVSATNWLQLEPANWQLGALARVSRPAGGRRPRRERPAPEWWDARVAQFAPEEQKASGRNLGGAPPKPYKDAAIEDAIEWLDQEGEQSQGDVVRHLSAFCVAIDDEGGPGQTTLKTWAKEALTEFRRRRQQLAGN